jgi:type III pantothenate kinase
MTQPRLIAVDIGNSATKIGWFDDAAGAVRIAPDTRLPVIADTRSFVTGQTPPAELLAALPAQRCRWCISSVHGEGARLLTEWVRIHRPADDVRLLSFRDLPIAIRVEFPDRVGLDRLAAAVAANLVRQRHRPAIVIGAGSAITVNLVTAEGIFAGGAILPGFRLAAEALFGGTERLPLATLAPGEEPPSVVGTHTEAAIRSGLFWGSVGAVREIVSRMSSQLAVASGAGQGPEIFVTGGDLRQFATYLGGDARFVPNLVLCGVAVSSLQPIQV